MDTTDAPTRLAEDFSDLSRFLHSSGDDEAAWQRLVKIAVEAIPGCEGVSVFKTGRAHKRAAPVAASDEVALGVARLQCDVREGPSVDAALADGPVASGDLSSEMRWPRFRVRVLAQSRVRSVMSFPVELSGAGAITFYSSQSDAFTNAVDAGALFAAHTRAFAVLAESVRKVVNLSEALTTSRTIGSAVGIVMLARKMTSEQAFEVLRETSQSLHIKIRDLAQLVNETGELPSAPPLPQRRTISAVPGPLTHADPGRLLSDRVG